MNQWKKVYEISLPDKEKFYSELNLEHITNEDYKHAKTVRNAFKIKNLFVQCDTLQLADVFEQFRNLCLKEYELDPAYFVSTPGLAMEACLKMTGVKLELLTNIDMMLMFEKGIRGALTQTVRRYAAANNKYMPNYDANVVSSYLEHLEANNLYGWDMRKKLPINGYKWAKNLNQYTEEFIKNYDEDSDLGYLFKVDAEYPKHLQSAHEDLPFLAEKEKNLVLIRNT